VGPAQERCAHDSDRRAHARRHAFARLSTRAAHPLGRRRGLGYLGRHRRTTGLGCAQSVAPATRRFGGREPVLGGERGLPGLRAGHPRHSLRSRLVGNHDRRARGAAVRRIHGSRATDAVRQGVTIGRRTSEHELEIRYRSTQGGRHTIRLPKDGSVTHVAVDGSPTQIRPDGGELPLSILPGQHTVSIGWRSQQGESPASSPDAVDLRAPSGNVTTSIALPADRWPLMALGAGVGPAFLYWGELLVFIVVARLLGRWPQSPLRTTEWLLLGLGLSTLSWSVLVTVAAWLFAVL